MSSQPTSLTGEASVSGADLQDQSMGVVPHEPGHSLRKVNWAEPVNLNSENSELGTADPRRC